MVVLCWDLMFVRKKFNTELISHKPLKSSGSVSLRHSNPECISLSSHGCKISSDQAFTGYKLYGDWRLGFIEQSKTLSRCKGPRGAGPLIPKDIASLKNYSLTFFGWNYCRRGDATSKDFFWPYFLWKVIFIRIMIFNQNSLIMLFFSSLLSFSLSASQPALETLCVAAVLEWSAKASRTPWIWSKSDCKWAALSTLGQPLGRWEMLEVVDFPVYGLVQCTGMQWQSTSGTCVVHVWVGSSQWALVSFNNVNLYMNILGLFYDRSQEGPVPHTCALACLPSPSAVSGSWGWVRQAKGFWFTLLF